MNTVFAVIAVIGLFATATPLILGSAVLAIMWRTWWLFPAWAWFLVPLGVPAISFWHFAALLLLITTVTAHHDIFKETREMDWGKWVVNWLMPIVTWALLRWMA